VKRPLRGKQSAVCTLAMNVSGSEDAGERETHGTADSLGCRRFGTYDTPLIDFLNQQDEIIEVQVHRVLASELSSITSRPKEAPPGGRRHNGPSRRKVSP